MSNKCIKCRNPLYKAGKIKVRGNYGRYSSIVVYYCKVCRWRGT